MSYNYNVSSLEKAKELLDALLDGQIHEIPADNPGNLSYILRQGIAAAQHNDIHPYALLSYTFKTKPGYVLAIPKETAKSTGDVTVGITRVNKKSSHYDVVMHLTKDPEIEVIFTTFKGDLAIVQNWADANNFTVASTEPLHLRRNA